MSAIDTCSLCPRLCRAACPVATGTAREAAVPAQIAGAVLAFRQGRLPKEVAADAVTLCVDCGACQDLCHLHVPLPEALRNLRREWATAPPPPKLSPPDDGAWLVVITPDVLPHAEALAAAVAERVGEEVGAWLAPHALGEGCLEHPDAAAHLDEVRRLAGGRRVVSAHHGVLAVLDAAGADGVALWELVGLPEPRTCGAEGEPMACCGGRAAFVSQHPEDALRMGRHWLLRGGPTEALDSRCAHHLTGCGGKVRSIVASFLEEGP